MLVCEKYITKELKEDIYRLFSNISNDFIVIHTSLIGVKGFTGNGSKQDILNELLETMLDASKNKTICFPTFNYDYCKTGIYDVKNSICQVGALNEFARKSSKFVRTHTPVFNFAILKNKKINLEPVENVFGEKSIFHEFIERNAAICLFGTDFTANTFFYYSEEIQNVGYRYIKPFKGKIIYENCSEQEFTVKYRVRPRIKGQIAQTGELIDYDYLRQRADIEKAGLLKKSKLCNSEAMWYNAADAYSFWKSELSKNELYFLNEQSQENVKRLYELYGYPLSYEKVEK